MSFFVARPRERGVPMYGVIRSYTGASELGDVLMERRSEVEELIKGTPGFIAYAAIMSGDNLTTITLSESKEGTDESTRRASEFVREHLSSLSTPEVTEGVCILRFTS
jgi:hypothetical protein